MNQGDHAIAHRLADNPIAIVGLSGLFPMARNFRDFWQNIVDATDCTSEVPATHWNVDDYYDADPTVPDKTYCRRGGFVPEVPFSVTEFGLPPNQLEVTTVVQLLSLLVARNVLVDAGAVGAEWYNPQRTGVVLGVAGPTTLSHPLAARLSTPVLKEVVRSCGLTQQDAEKIAEKYAAAFAPWEENSFPGLLGNVIAGRVANRLDLGGMNCTIDAACASSLSAVHVAISELVSGRADMMITGGCDTENSIFGYMCFSKTGALSKSERIKPLDDSADGTLVGEGVGMLALKRLSDAERDGDRVYAVIRGMGSSSDGRFKSIYAPRAEGQQAALQRAYTDADVSPATIELFEAHGTGTRAGDQTELTALSAVLGEATDEAGYAAIGSVKSQVGHTKGAAGAASLIKLALALHHKVLPPTINVSKPNSVLDPETSPFYVNTRTRPWILDPRRPKRRAATSALGFGGTNFHAVLEETTSDRTELRTMHRTARVHLWHAPNTAELVTLLRSGAAPTTDAEIPATHARAGFVAKDEQEAQSLRELAATELAGLGDVAEWSHPKGIFFRRQALPDVKVGALFAGQGSQYVDMGTSAVLNNPTVATAFDEANAAFADSPRPLATVVFPAPVFDPEVRNQQEIALRATDYAQPAIAALSVGQYRFLAERGLACTGFMGHSFGELTALWAAGSLTDTDLFALARARGQAMALPAEADRDPGTMAAVQADRETVTEILAAHPDVKLCNHNAPQQIVVGGGTSAVGAFAEACRERRLTVRELPVAAAFHTDYVAHAIEPFRAVVDATDIGAPNGTVYANSAGAEYGADVAANREVLTTQLLKPVEFVRGLEAMRADGCNVFVEFGPKGVLTQLVQRTLGDEVVAISTDQGPTGDSDAALKKAALRLAVLGLPIAEIDRHDAPALVEPEPKGMVVRLNGRDFVPDSRRETYRKALDEPTVLEAVAEAAEVAAAHHAPAITASAPEPAAAPTPEPVAAPAALTEQPEPAAQRSAHPSDVDDGSGLHLVAQQHLTVHSQYAEGQLRVAEGLVSVLREAQRSGDLDDRLYGTVESIKDQSLAIGQAHTRVNEILASLTDLELGGSLLVPERTESNGGNGFPALPAAEPTRPAALTAAPQPTAPAATPAPAATNGVAPAAPAVNGSAAAPAAPAGLSTEQVRTALVDVVSEKTGYPVDMLDLSMDLEADLGVDSIKRVQIMGALAERLDGVPAVGPEQVAELRSLTDIVDFIAKHAGSAAAPAATAGVSAEQVRSTLVEVVSEKTGYPVDMLDLSMDLEADLGVDSIKRVQIMGALAERLDGVPAVGPEQVAELRSLTDIVDFIAQHAEAPAAPAGAAPTAGLTAEQVRSTLVEVVSEKTGYPVDMLDLSMDLEADLGVDSIKRVQIMGALAERLDGVPAVGPEQVAELRSLTDIVEFVSTTGGAASAPAANVPAQQANAGLTADQVRTALVEVVSEKTGYPVDMLDLSMDLEADLGVDSIKRVQIMGAMGERLDGVPPVGPEQVAELRSLNDIVRFLVADKETGSTEASATVAGAVTEQSTEDADAEPVLLRIEHVRLPAVDRLDAPYRDNAVALVVDHGDDTAAVLADGLEQDGWTVRRLTVADDGTDAGVTSWTGESIEAGLTEALAGDDRIDLCLTVLPADAPWHPNARRLADSILVAKRVIEPLTVSATGGTRAAFVTVTRIDGALGHRGGRPANAALVGGIGGLVKTMAQEAPTVFCRALDLDPGLAADAVLDAVLDELVDAAVDTKEVAVDSDRSRWTVRPLPMDDTATDGGTEPALGDDEVIVVTGGARGVTARCVTELAGTGKVEFLLLGRTELADEPDWANGVADDALKPAVIQALRATGDMPTPKQVDRLTRDLLAQREIRATVDAVAATGSTAQYLAVDVTDPAATAEALAPHRDRVTGIVHGAGALADSFLPAKTPADIRTVLATKLDGLHNVSAALADAPLRHVILFGSVAGVLGNPGQADYAVANEALNRIGLSWKAERPDSRVTTVNWGAWDGGMVTPELREVFRSRGVPLLGMDAGARMFVGQFTPAHTDDVSVLVGPDTPLAPTATPATTTGFVAHRDLAGLVTDPVLLDHQVGTHPVFPAAAGLGWAVNALERANPGLRVVEVTGFEVLKGIVYDGTQDRDYWLDAAPGQQVDGRLTVKAFIRSKGDDGKALPPAHFAGTFVLAPETASAPVRPNWPGYPVGEGEENGLQVYRDADLFHGPLLQGLRRVLVRAERELVAECTLPDTPLGEGNFAGALHSPALSDVVLQVGSVLGVWFMNSGCLPLSIGRIEYFAPLPDDAPFLVVADDLRANHDRTQVTVTATACDPQGRVLQRYTDLAVIATPEMTAKFAEAVRLREQGA